MIFVSFNETNDLLGKAIQLNVQSLLPNFLTSLQHLLLLSYKDFTIQALRARLPIKNIDKYLQINFMKTKSKHEGLKIVQKMLTLNQGKFVHSNFLKKNNRKTHFQETFHWIDMCHIR